MSRQSNLILKMIEYEKGDTHRVNHLLKVYAFAKAIGEAEELSPELMEILETAAIVHDIGIKPSMEKYNSMAGPYQEKEGEIAARKMLPSFGYEREIVDRVSYLVGHHHTYKNIDGLDYQILVEADFLVNVYEHEMDRKEIESVRKNIFKTATGIKFLEKMFLK